MRKLYEHHGKLHERGRYHLPPTSIPVFEVCTQKDSDLIDLSGNRPTLQNQAISGWKLDLKDISILSFYFI